MENNSRLIHALDVYGKDRALGIAEAIGKEVRAIKVNWPLILGSGPGMITELSDYSRVICDFKVADIPNTNRLITEKVRDLGAWGIITHIFPGSDSLEAVIKAAGDMKVFAVVAMSHPGSSDFMDERIDDFARTAADSGVYGVVAPGNKPDILKKIRQKIGDRKIISPGIGAQGGDPAEAIRNGSDWVIAGRAIYESANPLAEVRRINRILDSS